jgi:hypothetical protein
VAEGRGDVEGEPEGLLEARGEGVTEGDTLMVEDTAGLPLAADVRLPLPDALAQALTPMEREPQLVAEGVDVVEPLRLGVPVGQPVPVADAAAEAVGEAEAVAHAVPDDVALAVTHRVNATDPVREPLLHDVRVVYPDAVAAAAVPVAAPSGEGVSRVSALRPPGDSVDKALRLRLGAALVGVKRAELLTVPLPVLVAVMDLVRVASPLAEVVSVARPLVEEVPVAVADTLGEALRNDVAVMLPEAVREALPRDVAVMLPEAVREALPRGVAEVEPDALAVPVPDPVEEPVRVPLPVEEPVRVKRPLVVLDDVLEGPANRVLKNSDNNRRRRFIGFFHRCGHK